MIAQDFSFINQRELEDMKDVFNVFASDDVCVSPSETVFSWDRVRKLAFRHSGTDENIGRRPQTSEEGFLRFLSTSEEDILGFCLNQTNLKIKQIEIYN